MRASAEADVPNPRRDLTDARLKTPRAAAVAGILFALLYASSVVLIRLAVPPELADRGEWLRDRAARVSLALGLVPIAGIAFLWFMGVIRDRIGYLEDQFFSTVFFGSGLLFLAMTFMSSALAGGLLATYAVGASHLIDSGLYTLLRAVMLRVTNAYAVKMAGVFMISLATIWLRTRTMPRGWIAFTYALALGLLLSIGSSNWVVLLFPAWVLAVSSYILASNLRGASAPAEKAPE
jgi:hypothetical protein